MQEISPLNSSSYHTRTCIHIGVSFSIFFLYPFAWQVNMAVAAQITLTPLNFHRSPPHPNTHQQHWSFLWLSPDCHFPFALRGHTFMHLLFLQRTHRQADICTRAHTHTDRGKPNPNIIENQNFKVNTAAVLATGKDFLE